MKCIPESDIRKQADSLTIRMLDQWHSLCREKVGTLIEVTVADRREYPYHGISTFKGEMNTSVLQPFGDRLILVLLLESAKKLDMIIVTHELGHWILRLQGLEELKKKNGDSYEELSSFCSHPALYELQRSLGLDPQTEIDRRAAQNVDILSRSEEPSDKKMRVQKALMYADALHLFRVLVQMSKEGLENTAILFMSF